MQSLRQAVCVIVHDEKAGKVVCIHYANETWSAVPAWTVPGGKVEEGERLDEAAARELREETGLTVAPEELRLVHTIQVRAGWDGKGPFLLSVFAATSWSGELTNTEPDKHLAVLWTDARALPTPMFPTSHAALTALVEALKDRGCGSVELRATAAGAGLYRTLGFEPLDGFMTLRPGPGGWTR